MPYTIKQAAEIMNVTPTTLRYYDKQGLLPFMERKDSGYRIFSDADMAMLHVIECLKKSTLKNMMTNCLVNKKFSVHTK